MEKITYITPDFAVTAALAPDDFSEVARLGFKAVLSNRPDDEDAGQLSARGEAVLAWRAGLRFAHVPASKLDLFTDPVIEDMDKAVRRLGGPILAHCKSGVRSAIIWAAASARSQPVDCVLERLTVAGFDLDFLRDELEAQADRKHWVGAMASALDCGCAPVVVRAVVAAEAA